NDLGGGVVDTGTIPFTDKVLRAGIVLDTRDNEMDPHRGVAAEALFASGTGYTRTTTSARVYVHPFRRLVLAGRLAAEGTGGTPPSPGYPVALLWAGRSSAVCPPPRLLAGGSPQPSARQSGRLARSVSPAPCTAPRGRSARRRRTRAPAPR